MKQYKLNILDDALTDTEQIFTYIAVELQSPIAAFKQYNRIKKAIESLDTFPARIKIMEHEPEKQKGLRQFLVDNYSIIFDIKDDVVTVYNVLYSASDISARMNPPEEIE